MEFLFVTLVVEIQIRYAPQILVAVNQAVAIRNNALASQMGLKEIQ
jgi:hypothetical protein